MVNCQGLRMHAHFSVYVLLTIFKRLCTLQISLQKMGIDLSIAYHNCYSYVRALISTMF